MNQDRRIGLLMLAGVAAALVWRIGVAPAVLGDFDPTDMPHRDRAFLSIGNVLTAALFATAQWSIARRADRGRRIAVVGAWAGIAGVACAFAGTVGLGLTSSANTLLFLYVGCTAVAWFATGLVAFQLFAGVIGLVGLITGLLYLVAAAIIFAGGHIIFVMAVAAAPLAFCLMVRRPWQDALARTTPPSARWREPPPIPSWSANAEEHDRDGRTRFGRAPRG